MFWLALAAITTGLQMASTYSAAKSKSKALAREGKMKAEQRARRTKALAGRQKASFLQSGIALTGEGTPQTLIGETYETGLEDIDLIKEGYNRQIGNTMGQARNKMIGQLGTFAMGAGMSAFSSAGSTAGQAGQASSNTAGWGSATQEISTSSGFGGF